MTKRLLMVLVLSVTLLGLTAAAVWPQLNARISGTEYRVLVAPVDPIDPFRGAYVQLTYPELRAPWEDPAGMGEGTDRPDSRSGAVYLVLDEVGGMLQTRERVRQRPSDGLYLTCDSDGWNTRCGIESWFLPQDEAKALEQKVGGGTVVATVKIDDRGNAALIAVQ